MTGEQVKNMEKIAGGKNQEFFSDKENIKKIFELNEADASAFLQKNWFKDATPESINIFKKVALDPNAPTDLSTLDENRLNEIVGGDMQRHLTVGSVVTAPLRFVSYMLMSIPANIIAGARSAWGDAMESHFTKEHYVKKTRENR